MNETVLLILQLLNTGTLVKLQDVGVILVYHHKSTEEESDVKS